jgi:hypothetical protein
LRPGGFPFTIPHHSLEEKVFFTGLKDRWEGKNLGENDMAEILRFLESMDTPDLSSVEAFLQARGVPAEKLRAAYRILEQMGLRYDSPPEEMPNQEDLMSMFNQLSSGLDSQTRQQFQGLMDRSKGTSRLNSSEDVLNYLKGMKRQ